MKLICELCYVSGYLVYDCSNLKKGKKVYFNYGVAGYSRVELFTLNNDFIQRHTLQPILNWAAKERNNTKK
jgi:hypothetical protein